MKTLHRTFLFAPFALASSLASAEMKTDTLSVPEASYERQKAVVTFDDAKTTVEALTRATARAGYPSKPAR
jgi:periplasmic mercuric ion binding protein